MVLEFIFTAAVSLKRILLQIKGLYLILFIGLTILCLLFKGPYLQSFVEIL